ETEKTRNGVSTLIDATDVAVRATGPSPASAVIKPTPPRCPRKSALKSSAGNEGDGTAVLDASSDKLLAQHRSPSAQRAQLGQSDFAWERCHAAVGAGNQFVCIHVFQRLAQGVCHLFGGFDLLAGHVNGAEHDSFAAHQ